MNCEVHNRSFQHELGNIKGQAIPIKNNPHKAFVEKLKKLVTSDESSSNTGNADSSDDDVCSEELMKELEAEFDELFADYYDDE